MTILILECIIITIFLIIAGFHFYWAFGGKKGIKNVIPTEENGEKNFSPPFIATLLVAIGFVGFSVFYLIKMDIIQLELPSIINQYLGWLLASIFIIRSIGDFNYVGFFKKKRNTDFAKFDTKYFSPLTFVIGIMAILIEVLS